MRADDAAAPEVGARIARAYAAVVVALRWPLVVGWTAATVAEVVALPPLSQTGAGALGRIVPQDSPALAAERASAAEFAFPLFSRTIVVRRDAHGLAAGDYARWTRSALRLSSGGHADDQASTSVAGALPLANLAPLAGATPEHGTTLLAYLLFRPSISAPDRAEAGRTLARGPFGPSAHATGVVPARVQTTDVIVGHLWLVELATAALVALVVGLHFRAPLAPLAALAVVAVSYLIAARVLPWLADRAGVAVPQEVAPMIVVLLFGALTDYMVFFLSRCRALLRSGVDRTDAARGAARDLAGIVTVAAAIVTGASCTLVLADFAFFRAFGPGMAAAIAIGWLVVMTLAPALLAIFGRALFWPTRPAPAAPSRRMRRVLKTIARHPLLGALAVIAPLAAGAAGLIHVRLGDPAIRGLPASADARAGYRDLSAGFGPGFAAPTLIVIRGRDLAARRSSLATLQRALERRKGVAAVLGPADNPLPGATGAVIARDGRTARLALVFAVDPLAPAAIDRVRALRDQLPGLLRDSGLADTHALVGGDTALSADTIALALRDLATIGPAVLIVVALLLALYPRAVVVPVLVVAASVVALASAIGVTAWVWDLWLGHAGLAYYVPFAVAVLLLGLGSDYSVLLVGRIWRAARDREVTGAISDAGAQAARPIGTAGLVLALSFALLALVPLWEFRQFALAMAAGLLADAFIVRPLLIPALVALAARRGAAPSAR
jgi:RND superfamily putative drug exporter